ncbi:MAG: hypothetical protein DRR19_24465 [Candidatus Parabeggiatoa sp. nov. 1]|nr:MAG: hypothetical protein DRR19_24465 [Gammaproteobacteria bacterium]
MIKTKLQVRFTAALALTVVVCSYQNLTAGENPKESEALNTLHQSQKTWKALKKANNGEYSYSRSFQSWVGFRYATRFTVKDDIVTKREYESSFRASTRDTWVEEGADVGTHQDGHDVLLIEQLYEQCAKEVLTKDRASHSIYFRLDSNGLLKTCIHVPKNCADDCSFGVDIDKITFGK